MLDRFEKIGLQIMNRAGGGGPFDADPIAGVLGDPAKRTVAAQILGQAYVTAHNLALANRAGDRARSPTPSRSRREIMGDELLRLLESAEITIPELDLADEAVWPPLEFSAAIGRGPQPLGPPQPRWRRDVSETTAPATGDDGPASSRPSRPSRSASPSGSRAPTGRASAAYRSRFAIIYVALALVAGIGVGAFVVLWRAPIRAPPAKWSTWQPTGSDTAQAEADRRPGGEGLPAATTGSSSRPRSSARRRSAAPRATFP